MHTENLPSYITVEKPLRTNHRYKTYSGKFHDKPAFIKVVVVKRLTKRLLNEVAGLHNFEEIQKELPNDTFLLPAIYEVGQGYIVYSHEPGRTIERDDEERNQAIGRLVELYVLIDTCVYRPNAKISKLVLPSEHTLGATSMEATIKKCLELEDKFSKYIDTSLVMQVVAFLRQNAPQVPGQFAHGDLTPGNLLWQPEHPPTIIDFESCSLLWPQYYELINCLYNSYILRENFTADLANELLAVYRQKQNINNTALFVQTCNVSVAWRGLSLIIEILGPKTEEHNTSVQMSQRHANLLTRSFENILAGKQFSD